MIESYIEPGNQKIGCDHIYGKSITDPCLGWEESERLLYTIAEMCQCADKLILETILQDKFSYFKAEERGVAVATATDDNAEIRNLDVRLFKKTTC